MGLYRLHTTYPPNQSLAVALTMSSNNPVNHSSRELVAVSSRDLSSVDETQGNSSSLTILESSMNKKRKTITNLNTSAAPQVTLSGERKVQLDGLVKTVLTKMKDVRKVKHAIQHYENFVKEKKVPQDLNIDVKFGNPYPKAVFHHKKEDLAPLIQLEKDIWEKAKWEIVQLRLQTLQQSVKTVEDELAASRKFNHSDSIKIDDFDEYEAACDYFETHRDSKVAELKALFDKNDKVYEARQAKKASKLRARENSAMEVDDIEENRETVELSPTERLEATLLKLVEKVSEMQKEITLLKGSQKNQKNDKAPDSKGRGKPVQEKKRKESNRPFQTKRPMQTPNKSMPPMMPPPLFFPFPPYTANPGMYVQEDEGWTLPRRRPSYQARVKNKKPEIKKRKDNDAKNRSRAGENRARR